MDESYKGVVCIREISKLKFSRAEVTVQAQYEIFLLRKKYMKM